MPSFTITKECFAEQWLGEGHPLSNGMYLCQPEVHWSASRDLVYFTYADLRSTHWMDVKPKEFTPDANIDTLCEGFKVERPDGSAYYRQTYPFALWSIKSEASITQRHHAVYLDRTDAELVAIFVDYMYSEGWTNPLPAKAEYRVVNGSYGRGFKPIYLNPGDWLVTEKKQDPYVLSNDKFQEMRHG